MAMVIVFTLTSMVVLLAVPALASADGGAPSDGPIPLSLLEQAKESAPTIRAATDAEAARELPHRELGREEAVELTESVFGPELAGAAGIFGELDVKKYLSEDAAIVSSAAGPEDAVKVGGGPGGNADSGGRENVLLESTLPLETEGPLGAPVPVDLSLESGGSGLAPAAPLVEVEIPKTLGEPIELPETGVGIELVGAPSERAPTVIDESVAAYPNVATDTDFSVAPTPTGVETLTTIRSAESPDSETLRLDLPEGDTLVQEEAGAVVDREGRKVASILPPTATDADGAAVPVTMTVEGDSLTLEVLPGPTTAYPLLLDPIVESDDWYDAETTTGQGGWHFVTNIPPTPGVTPIANNQGLDIWAHDGWYYNGSQAGWYYYVPRLKEEEAQGRTPTSYIVRMDLMHVSFFTSPGPISPYEIMGVLGQDGWAGIPEHEDDWVYLGNSAAFYAIHGYPQYPGWGLNFENGEPGKRDHTAKVGLGLGLASVEVAELYEPREAGLGGAMVEVADEEPPTVKNPSEPPWMNQTAKAPITVEAADTGLGVKSISFELPGGQGTRTYTNPCTGTAENPCPNHWSASVGAKEYNPATMAQGVDNVPIHAQDAALNTSAPGEVTAKLRIDHTPPVVAVSGTLVSQAEHGGTLPRYSILVTATDGTAAAPQSGVVSLETRIDGTLLGSPLTPGCATQNCSISTEQTISAAEYPGAHTLEVKATDGVGLSTTKKVSFDALPDKTPPTMSLSGKLVEGPEGWVYDEANPVTVRAEDPGGYGVTHMTLSVDGVTKRTLTQPCTGGGCSGKITWTCPAGSLTAGEHTVEVVVEDGAGNKTSRHVTIFADPKGNVPVAEATATLEGTEESIEEAAVAPIGEVLEPAQIEPGDEPHVAVTGGEVSVTGVVDDTEIGTSPEAGFTIQAPGGPQTIVPTVDEVATSPGAANGAAAVTADSQKEVDTSLRPEYDGDTQFEDIRSAESPETFSWTMTLTANEHLVQVDSEHVEVQYFDGSTVMLISAEKAHDVTGRAVPTTLSFSGDVLTLTVHHREAAYAYPVVAGQSFEVGASTVTVIGPPPAPPGAEEEEEPESSESPPAPNSDPRAQPLWYLHAKKFGEWTESAPHVIYGNQVEKEFSVFDCGGDEENNCKYWEVPLFGNYLKDTVTGEIHADDEGLQCVVHIHTGFGDIPYAEGAEFPPSGPKGWISPLAAVPQDGQHLTAFCHYELSSWPARVGDFEVGSLRECKAVQAWIWPNGWVQKYHRKWNPGTEPNRLFCAQIGTG